MSNDRIFKGYITEDFQKSCHYEKESDTDFIIHCTAVIVRSGI